MVEFIDNVSQFAVTLVAGCLSAAFYCRSRKQPYLLLACFYGCFALAGLYWTLYYLLFSETPQLFYVSETGWISGYIFLCLLQFTLSDEEERAFRCRAMWLSPIVGILLAVYYVMYGDVLATIIMNTMTIFLSRNSIRGLVYLRGQGGERRKLWHFHLAVTCFVAVEYCLWTFSCFWMSDTLANPYFWFDFMLTGMAIVLLIAVKRVVGM